MSNSFCRYLTNGLRVQSWYGELVASPCCYLPQYRIDSSEFEQRFDEYHKRSKCYNCLYYVNNDTSSRNYPPNRASRLIGDVDHTHPVYAELSIDNKCNAACMSCTDSFSSMWAEQNKKFNIKTEDDYPDPQNDSLVVDKLFDKFNFSYLTELNFLGGEPLISKANLLVMERLIEQGIAKNVGLLFTTNGSTQVTDHYIEVLSHFRKVTFSYSIDGIGDRFHYLRYPLKWEKLQSVIDSTRQITQIKDLKFIVNMTVSALSVFYIDEVVHWALDYFNNDPRLLNVHTPPCTDIMSLSALPKEANIYLREKYKNLPRVCNMFNTNIENSQAIDKLISHLTLWDKNRKLSWEDTFPEAVEFYKKYL